MNTVRLVIVGFGLAGRRHADAIAQVEHVELAGIVEPNLRDDDDAATDVAVYKNLADLFADAKPHGVMLATPTPLHVAQGLECVANRCPAFVEKPLATTAADARQLVDAASQADVPLLVGHHRRHNPLIHKARDLIAAGKIGDIRAVHANCWFYKPDEYFDAAAWRKRKGAGPVSVNLAHDVDLLRYLCGEIVSVQAQATAAVRGYENEDVAAAVVRFANDAIGTITVSDSIVAPWSWELTSREYPIYPATAQSCYLIGGSHGALSIPHLSLWTHKDARNWWTPINATSIPRDTGDPLINQIAHFAEVIRGNAEPLVSGMEGLKTLQVIEAIQSSAANNEIVFIA